MFFRTEWRAGCLQLNVVQSTPPGLATRLSYFCTVTVVTVHVAQGGPRFCEGFPRRYL